MDYLKLVGQWPALQAADPEAKKKAAITRYQAAKHTASDAKAKGNKEGQAAAGRLIRELKSELAFLGLLLLFKFFLFAQFLLV